MKYSLIALRRPAFLAALLLAAVLSGCVKDGKESTQDGNFTVVLLFEKDGCKVYRFKDGDHYVYWSNCEGKVQSDVWRSTGKSGYMETTQAITNSR